MYYVLHGPVRKLYALFASARLVRCCYSVNRETQHHVLGKLHFVTRDQGFFLQVV